MTESIGPEGAAVVAEARDTINRLRTVAFAQTDETADVAGVATYAADLLVALLAEVERLTQAHERLREEAEDARMGHARLDETRAKETGGQALYNRIGWIIELLTREHSETRHMLTATGLEKESAMARAGAAEHRRAAAEYRAQRIVLDAELKAENARLREALAEIGDCGGKGFSHYCPNCSRKFNGNVALHPTPAPADERT